MTTRSLPAPIGSETRPSGFDFRLERSLVESDRFQTIALVGHPGVAYATYFAAVREAPDGEVRLIHNGRVLAHHGADASRTEDHSLRAFYNLDRELRFTWANAAALAIWGKSRAEVLGKTLEEAFPAACGSAAMEAHMYSLKSFKPFHGELTSPVLGCGVRLEIYPSASGVRVSFVTDRPSPRHS